MVFISFSAQYHQAQLADESKEIGEQIARLKEANRLMEQTNSYLPLASNFSTENAAIKKALDAANKDNDFIVSVAKLVVYYIVLLFSTMCAYLTFAT